MEIVFGVVLSLTAAVVGVWQISGRDRDRPIHGPRDDGTLGLPHLQRWSAQSRQPRFYTLRRNLPMLNIGRLIKAVIGLVLVAGLVFGAVSLYGFWQARSEARLTDELSDIQRMHVKATALTDSVKRYQALDQALTAANALVAEQGEGAIDQALLDARAAIQADLDNLTQISRIPTIQPIGAVPGPASGQRSRLIMGDGRLFLLAGSFYQVDVTSRTLVQLLAPGDTVAGIEVGELLGVAWREDGPIVIDAHHAYVYDLTLGNWTALDLGSSGDVPTPPTDIAGIDIYDFNLYALDHQTGLIVKFPGGDYSSGAQQWSNSVAAPELKSAIDLAVTGSIYALMPDGRVIKLYLGEVAAVIEPELIPAFDRPVAFGVGTSGKYLYVVNGSDGRVARLDLDGKLVQQFKFDSSVVAPSNVMDVAVDESTGIAYLVTGDGLYTMQFPAPPAEEPAE